MTYTKWQPKNKLPSSVRVWHMSTPLQFLIALILLVIVVFFVWFLFSPKSSTITDSQDIPIIQAPPGPARIRSDSPGAPEIPYQDKKIYQEFAPQDKNTTDPDLLLYEQPEEPMMLREASEISTLPQKQDTLLPQSIDSSHPYAQENDLIGSSEKQPVMLAEKLAQNEINIRLQPERKPNGQTNNVDAEIQGSFQNPDVSKTPGAVKLKRKPRLKQ